MIRISYRIARPFGILAIDGGQRLVGQLHAVGLAAQVGKLDPHLRVFLDRHNQAAQLEHALPHLDVTLRALQPELAQSPKDRNG